MKRPFHIIAVTSILSIYLYFFWEWLFNVFKPSFLNRLSLRQQIEVLLLAPVPLALVSLAILFVIFLFSYLIATSRLQRVFPFLWRTIPALTLAAMTLVTFDTSIYILAKSGITRSYGIYRGLWISSFALLFIYFLNVIRRTEQYWGSVAACWQKKAGTTIALVLLLFSLLLATTRLIDRNLPRSPILVAQTKLDIDKRSLPNIIVFGGDALNANRMSAYGYARDTTPFIKSVLEDALIFDNAFPNGTATLNSIPSFWSGKLPITSHVLYYPDIFRGSDSYEHILGILRAVGYHTNTLTTPYVVDPFHLNMRGAVDSSNLRYWGDFDMPLVPRTYQAAFENERMLLLLAASRLEERLLHMLNLRDMYDHEAEIQRLENRNNSDQWRVSELIKIIGQGQEPFFIHAHLMGTHGQMFFPRHQVFSKNKTQNTPWDDDFYDDAILDFDRYFSEVFSELQQSGKLARTLIIVLSDHDKDRAIERTPLLIWFPNGDHKGRITESVQHLDIDATILDYIGLLPPPWLRGQSLLSPSISKDRMLSVTSGINEFGRTKPYFNLSQMSAIICDHVYTIDLLTDKFTNKIIVDHTDPCDSSTLPTNPVVRKMIIEQLHDSGYDVSGLR